MSYVNTLVIGLISAVVVGLLSIFDFRRKGEQVNLTSVFKIVLGVWASVSGVVYFSNNLTDFSEKIGTSVVGGGVSSLDLGLDTGLPNF